MTKKHATLCVKVNSRFGVHSGGVSVTPFNGCNPGKTSRNTQLLRNSEQFQTYSKTICPEKLPYVFIDSIYENFGTHLYVLQTSDFCSPQYIMTVLRPPFFDNDPLLVDTSICVGGAIQFGDQIYNTPGEYEFILPNIDPYRCDTTAKLNLSISGDLPPQIQCVNDTFLNVLSINWDDIRLADGYFVLINGDTVSDQSHRGFFYTPNPNGEQIDLKIQPYNSRGCSFEAGFASCFVEPTTGVFEENLDEKIQIFPNPSSAIFNIESDVLVEKTTVLNIFGEKIFETNSNKIELDQFPSGIYFFVIKTLRKTAVRKVLKN